MRARTVVRAKKTNLIYHTCIKRVRPVTRASREESQRLVNFEVVYSRSQDKLSEYITCAEFI